MINIPERDPDTVVHFTSYYDEKIPAKIWFEGETIIADFGDNYSASEYTYAAGVWLYRNDESDNKIRPVSNPRIFPILNQLRLEQTIEKAMRDDK